MRQIITGFFRSKTLKARVFACTRRTIVTYPRPLVGPPDPLSNLRPVLYGPPSKLEDIRSSPYSVTEFSESQAPPTANEQTEALEWRWEQESLDAFNQAFWTDNNMRFEAARRDILAAHPPLPPDSPPEALTARERALEATISEFYANWVNQQRSHYADYTREWYRRNWGGILGVVRRRWEKWMHMS